MTASSSTDLIEGLHVLRLKDRNDGAWDAPYFEQGHNIPFACKRIFYIAVDGHGVERGGHANSCDELIVAVNGSVLIEVDNGSQRGSARLNTPEHGAWIQAGLMIHLREFAPRTLLMVFASQSYADTQHFDRPQPRFLTQERFC